MANKKITTVLLIVCVLGTIGTFYTAILDRKLDWSACYLALSSSYFLWYIKRKRTNKTTT